MKAYIKPSIEKEELVMNDILTGSDVSVNVVDVDIDASLLG